jgi:hypothetical protein
MKNNINSNLIRRYAMQAYFTLIFSRLDSSLQDTPHLRWKSPDRSDGPSIVKTVT